MSDATARQFFGGLPFEIISEIFAHLNTRLLIKCMSLSRLWYEFVPQCTDQWSTIVFRGTLIPGSKSRWSQSIGRCVKRVELRNMDEDTLYLAMERLIEINCHQIGSLRPDILFHDYSSYILRSTTPVVSTRIGCLPRSSSTENERKSLFVNTQLGSYAKAIKATIRYPSNKTRSFDETALAERTKASER
ncbi:hypothetical protein BDA99DRAFT_555928 [Phascolomyces articulosus]|uniref:F-box domain-containing protein n=1 Tax=Phascolomyces articulosus TaxID=60185 RepID=A0AAD5KKW1_9FUNG|nr:hypothetical protein BDA99DRAFT_555928 [Phascolomyces articulosus]